MVIVILLHRSPPLFATTATTRPTDDNPVAVSVPDWGDTAGETSAASAARMNAGNLVDGTAAGRELHLRIAG